MKISLAHLEDRLYSLDLPENVMCNLKKVNGKRIYKLSYYISRDEEVYRGKFSHLYVEHCFSSLSSVSLFMDALIGCSLEDLFPQHTKEINYLESYKQAAIKYLSEIKEEWAHKFILFISNTNIKIQGSKSFAKLYRDKFIQNHPEFIDCELLPNFSTLSHDEIIYKVNFIKK